MNELEVKDLRSAELTHTDLHRPRKLILILVAAFLAVVLCNTTSAEAKYGTSSPRGVNIGRNCTWKATWAGSYDIMEDRKTLVTDLVVAEWQEPCKVTFKATKAKTPRKAELQISYKGKWIGMYDGLVAANGNGSFTINDDPDYWVDVCDYRKFPYRIVVAAKGNRKEIIGGSGLLFLFSSAYYDCQSGDTDWSREYYNLGKDPDKNACWNVVCASKGKPVLSHESRKYTGYTNSRGQYKCRWYKFYTYKDGSQAPSELVSEWWSSSSQCD
jgi:hypothetical protein